VTSKQPKGGQGATGESTRSGPGENKVRSGENKSGPVKMLQGIGYNEFTENSRQDRVDGKVW